MTEFTNFFKPTLKIIIKRKMSWTRLQFYDTGKSMLTASYNFNKGVEYRILFNKDDSLSILAEDNHKYCTICLDYLSVQHDEFTITSTVLVPEKPILLCSEFDFGGELLTKFQKNFIIDLIQDHLQVIPQNPSGVM